MRYLNDLLKNDLKYTKINIFGGFCGRELCKEYGHCKNIFVGFCVYALLNGYKF